MTARSFVAALALASVSITSVASAQPGAKTIAPGDAAAVLRAAAAAGAGGDWQRAGELLEPLDLEKLERGDRAEAHRLRGLVWFFRERPVEAEADFLAYLRLELDGHLDPTVTPPEAVSFFEDVRARHATELRALRPKPRRWLALNLLPPWGQFQNGQRTKGWVIAGVGAGLLAVDVASYAMLRSWCSSANLTCDDGGSHTSAARTLRAVNLIAGGALVALYVFGVGDGFAHRHHGLTMELEPATGGGSLVLSGRF
ncbi:MAG: hypothetical protein K8W52_13975 [Deltaproteobacteria bacterium]|nr:hypothetical protein [Deltaproteobacteria bacterium]